MKRTETVSVQDATQEDAAELIQNMRVDDRWEVIMVTGKTVDHVVRDSVLVSKKVWAARSQAGLVALFGYANIDDTTGVPWLLGTDLMEHHAKDLLKLSPPYIKLMKSVYPTLTNIVTVDNSKAITWLSWLGFQFSEPILAGFTEVPVRVFRMTNN